MESAWILLSDGEWYRDSFKDIKQIQYSRWDLSKRKFISFLLPHRLGNIPRHPLFFLIASWLWFKYHVQGLYLLHKLAFQMVVHDATYLITIPVVSRQVPAIPGIIKNRPIFIQWQQLFSRFSKFIHHRLHGNWSLCCVQIITCIVSIMYSFHRFN